MRIAVCDDDQAQVCITKSYINKWSAENQHEFEIYEFNSAETFLFSISSDLPFDLIFLDIQMGKMSGIDLAKNIRQHDQKVVIVFISGLQEHVFEGYDVNALHYLLKPLKYDKFAHCLEQALHLFMQSENDYYLLQINGENIRLRYNEIMYFEVYLHYIHVHTLNEKYIIREKINALEQELPHGCFVRCHRSFIVNMKFVSNVKQFEVTFDNGKTVPISTYRWTYTQDGFLKYYIKANNI